jgi:predicted nucleic acid-binding protein
VTTLFLDTSAFAALAHRRDRNHGAATRLLRTLQRRRRALITSTYVLDELLTLLRVRWDHRTAVKAGEALLRTRWCRVVDIPEATRMAAWQIFVRYADQTFSFTDCTTFALMHEMGLDEAFTFDRTDFSAAGFTALP